MDGMHPTARSALLLDQIMFNYFVKLLFWVAAVFPFGGIVSAIETTDQKLNPFSATQIRTSDSDWIVLPTRAVPTLVNPEIGCTQTSSLSDDTPSGYSISSSENSTCIYFNGKFVSRQLESREFQVDLDRAHKYVWTTEETQSRSIIRLFTQGKIFGVELLAEGSPWQIVSTSGNRRQMTLLLRQRNGSALRVATLSPEGIVVKDRRISISQYATLTSPVDVNLIDICPEVSSNSATAIRCVFHNYGRNLMFFEVGNCVTHSKTILYVHGGPLVPSLPILEYEVASRLLQGTSRENDEFCIRVPALFTSSNSFSDSSFEAAAVRTQKLVKAVSNLDAEAISNDSTPSSAKIVVVESFGSQALDELLDSEQNLVLIFFSALLDEDKFSRNLGAVVDVDGVVGDVSAELVLAQSKITEELANRLKRPSLWRHSQFFQWLAKRNRPVLVKACERSAPTSIVVAFGARDPRATINPLVQSQAIAACTQRKHFIEFVESPLSEHATPDVADFTFTHSALITKSLSKSTKEE